MAKNAKPAATSDDVKKKTIAFEYIKSQFFRVVHADGALGSVTPNGDLHIAFYSERFAIPKMTVHPRNLDGTIGEPIPDQTLSRKSIIREIDVDVVFSSSSIDDLVEWLQMQKKSLQTRQKTVASKLRGKKDVH